jgi:hypothetical protein
MERHSADERNDGDRSSDCDHELHLDLHRSRWIELAIGGSRRDFRGGGSDAACLAHDGRGRRHVEPELEFRKRRRMYGLGRMERRGCYKRDMVDGSAVQHH